MLLAGVAIGHDTPKCMCLSTLASAGGAEGQRCGRKRVFFLHGTWPHIGPSMPMVRYGYIYGWCAHGGACVTRRSAKPLPVLVAAWHATHAFSFTRRLAWLRRSGCDMTRADPTICLWTRTGTRGGYGSCCSKCYEVTVLHWHVGAGCTCYRSLRRNGQLQRSFNCYGAPLCACALSAGAS